MQKGRFSQPLHNSSDKYVKRRETSRTIITPGPYILFCLFKALLNLRRWKTKLTESIRRGSLASTSDTPQSPKYILWELGNIWMGVRSSCT